MEQQQRPGKWCPECRQLIDAQATTCPWCRHRFGVSVGQVAGAGLILLAVGLGVVLFVARVWF